MWARVVTPTCGVRVQCISREASSPAWGAHILSPGRPGDPPDVDAGDQADSVSRFAPALTAAVVLVLAALITVAAPSHAIGGAIGHRAVWHSPTGSVRLVEVFAAPADRYSRGHRGVDLAVARGAVLLAPAGGVVAFSGKVADRTVVTIDHGDGYVSTLEPVDRALPVGAEVRKGDPVARAGSGGHSPPGAVHLGVRLDGEYVNPMSMIGGVRAILLPCC